MDCSTLRNDLCPDCWPTRCRVGLIVEEQAGRLLCGRGWFDERSRTTAVMWQHKQNTLNLHLTDDG